MASALWSCQPSRARCCRPVDPDDDDGDDDDDGANGDDDDDGEYIYTYICMYIVSLLLETSIHM